MKISQTRIYESAPSSALDDWNRATDATASIVQEIAGVSYCGMRRPGISSATRHLVWFIPTSWNGVLPEKATEALIGPPQRRRCRGGLASHNAFGHTHIASWRRTCPRLRVRSNDPDEARRDC